MAYLRRVDSNQSGIVEELLKRGFSVRSLAALGKGVPDLLVARGGINLLVELKSEKARVSGKKMRETDDRQREFRMLWQGPVIQARTADEIVAWFDHEQQQELALQRRQF
jgi:hypothetical protein